MVCKSPVIYLTSVKNSKTKHCTDKQLHNTPPEMYKLTVNYYVKKQFMKGVVIFFDKNRHCANIPRNIDFKDIVRNEYKEFWESPNS